MSEFILGIDLGTTTAKVSAINIKTKLTVFQRSKITSADVECLDPKFAEQCVSAILSAVQTCLLEFPENVMKQVIGIGLCGQMHGIVLWDDASNTYAIAPHSNTYNYFVNPANTSNLYTWQDNRCDAQFLSELPKASASSELFSGYGCATLFWLNKHQPEYLQKFTRAGTIVDYIVATICGLEDVIMSTHNAASWGYFDLNKCEWDRENLKLAGFPVRFLPKLVHPKQAAGVLTREWCHLPPGIPVGVGLGDFQCSMYGSIGFEKEAILNIGTSAQLAFAMDEKKSNLDKEAGANVWPYFGEYKVAVAASLNGGNVLADFAKVICAWMKDLNCNYLDEGDILKKLMNLTPDYEEVKNAQLKIEAVPYGERGSPNLKASVTDITMKDANLGLIFGVLSKSIIENIHRMMPKRFLDENGIDHIIGVGNALRNNHIMKRQVEELYSRKLICPENVDASFGAAVAFANEVYIKH